MIPFWDQHGCEHQRRFLETDLEPRLKADILEMAGTVPHPFIDGGPVDGLTVLAPRGRKRCPSGKGLPCSPWLPIKKDRRALSRVAKGDERSELALDKAFRACYPSLNTGAITVNIQMEPPTVKHSSRPEAIPPGKGVV